MWQIWLIAAGLFFIIEIATVGFLVFWLGIGALFAMVVSFFTDNIIIQATIFLLSSTALILGTKPIIKKFINSKDNTITNAYSIIGKIGIVTQDINYANGTGQVKINGEIWSAKSDLDCVIPKDTKVEIIRIDGVKVIVSITKILDSCTLPN